MAVIYNIDGGFDFDVLDGSSAAFGVFDGVHRGHRYLLAAAQGTAADEGGRSIALTFDRDPDELFRPEHMKKLLTNEDRLDALARSGVDAVCVLPFTREFAAKSPEEFLESTFEGHAPAHLHVGVDFSFGAGASGHVAELEEWARANGTDVHAHHLVSSDGLPVTATRIRDLLAEGRCEEAAELLGRPYALHDIVRPGRRDGREFGFRTANLELPVERQVAAEAVYGGYAFVDGRRYRAAIAVGKSPVFESGSTATCEVNILDFDRDIYGQDIWVELHHYLRPMIKFDSIDQLIATVKGNIQWVRDNMDL
ncbi:riboflavin biosynthesis protein RibF [Curtanaerobium respiraculi]|uniref:riboflavin biosynthesis protein RibF n=1 Tax=Curtanaerobium respiraculi TaxID=2949669 RepID=UPI0024B3C837|nr:riboflavin biosynthesis protein RibF [Curtanaerobium respiraculi]